MDQGELDQSERGSHRLNQSEASLASGPLNESSFQNLSRLPEHYFVNNRQSITSGPLELGDTNNVDDVELADTNNVDDDDKDLSSGNVDVGYLDESTSSSYKPGPGGGEGILDKYLLSQSSQSIDNFLTPSLGSVQSGLLETSSMVSGHNTALDTTGQYQSNRSSLVLSEDDMRSVSSGGGALDMDNMMVEVGNLDSSNISSSEFQTLLSNRDAVIQKLSSNLHKLMRERREDADTSQRLETWTLLLPTRQVMQWSYSRLNMINSSLISRVNMRKR